MSDAVEGCVRVADRLPVGDRVLVRVVDDFVDVSVVEGLAVIV